MIGYPPLNIGPTEAELIAGWLIVFGLFILGACLTIWGWRPWKRS